MARKKTWLLLTSRHTCLMVGGSDFFYKRMPRIGQSWPLPPTWWSASDHEPPGTVISDLTRPEPQMWQPPPAPGDQTKILQTPRTTAPCLFLHRPVGKDSKGMLIYDLLAVSANDSQKWRVFSGRPTRQEIVNPNSDQRGSGRPIPHGLYRVGGAEINPRGWGEGLGTIWHSLVEFRPRHGRTAIGIHQDANSSYAFGSDGCVVHPDLAVIREISSWIGTHRPAYLVVDYGFGLEAELKAAGLV